jgi:Ca-activated chloride channel family protein
MRFLGLAPGVALALLAAVAAAVVLLYLLKPSPRRLTVASTLIWRRVLRERKRTPDRLRWWISLLMAAAVALSVALALTRPEVAVVGGKAQRVALVLDDSITLGTLTSDGKTRWDHALQRARGVLRSGGAGSRYLVADTQRLIASPRFEETDAALATLGRLHVVAGGEPVFPDVVRPGDAEVRLVFVTDGVSAMSPPPGAETLSVFQVADNAGITAFDVRAVPGDPRRHQAFVEVLNASPGTKQVELQVAGAGGPALTRMLTIAGGAAVSETLDVSGFDGGPLRASVSMQYDALQVDDVAYSFAPGKKSIRVGLVTTGNAFLERSLRLLPRVQVVVTSPAGFSARSGVDAWVFDRYAPKHAPGAPALLIRPSRVDWLPAAAGDLGETAVSAWVRGHPVTDGLSLRDVLAGHALAIRAGADSQVIATDARGRPLILASVSGQRWVEVAFALEDSNLPLQAGFPVLLSNVLNWMTGEPLAMQAGLGLVQLPVAGAKVLDVQGQKVATREVPGATLIEAEQPGFYTAIALDRRLRVAVNVADPAVTAVNSGRLAAERAAPAPPASAARWAANPWSALLLIAALLLVLEWWTYNWRITV